MNDFKNYLDISDPIDVIIFKENDESFTLHSVVYEVVDSEKLVLAHPLHQGGLFPLAKSNVYYFRFFKENLGMYLFKGLVHGRLAYDQLPSIIVSLASPIKRVQRREFFRVAIYSPGYFIFTRQLTEEELEEKKIKLKKKFPNADDIYVEDIEEEKVNFEMVDISGGGMKISIKTPYNIGEVLNGAFKIESSWVNFKGEVIRQDKKDHFTYELGIKFLEVDDVTQSKIVSYVFEKERNLIKKGLMTDD